MNDSSDPDDPLIPENDLFYFESDHLALKGNADYNDLLKTLVTLQSQRAKAIKDYDIVAKRYKDVLDDPLELLQQLQLIENQQNMDQDIPVADIVPAMQRIESLPNINWEKYGYGETKDDEGNTTNRNETVSTFIKQYLNAMKDDSDVSSENVLSTQTANSANGPHQGFKPPLYALSNNDKRRASQHWTADEQKRLEELLIIYPPEDVELRRYKKIAAALGTRTVMQVSSRLQKYFKKLHGMGLPIPGRIPKSSANIKKCHPHQRYNHYLLKPSTFFPELDVPVRMDENEPVPGPSREAVIEPQSQGSNYLMPSSSYISSSASVRKPLKSDAELQLALLMRIRTAKMAEEASEDENAYVHTNFSCDYCGEDPIRGTRWHCQTCEVQTDCVDFCTDCLIAQMYSEMRHPLDHEFLAIGSFEEEIPESGDKSST